MTAQPSIPGYEFGASNSAHSPLSMEDLQHLEQTVGWKEQEARRLHEHAEFFRAHAEPMVDAWRSVIGAQPHLAQWFFGPDGKPDDEYKARVKKRFVQWVIDVAERPHDQAWLNYQEEIGLRHTPQKKNKTDGRHTPDVVPMRYLIAFLPVVVDIRNFTSKAIADPEKRSSIENAWAKAVCLHITLWTRPYVQASLW